MGCPIHVGALSVLAGPPDDVRGQAAGDGGRSAGVEEGHD